MPVLANSRIVFPSNFSAAERQLAEKILEQRRTQAQEAAAAQNAKAARAREAAAKSLRDTVGAANFHALREFLQAERAALVQSLQPPAGLRQQVHAVRKSHARKAETSLRRLGVDKAKLAAIAEKYHEAIGALLPEPKATPGFHLRSNLRKWQGLSKLHAVPLDWGVLGDIEPDPNDPHRWFLFQPAFFGFNFKFVPVHNEHFVVDRLHHLDPRAGMVGHEVTMEHARRR
jgi:hypothetical protein